MQKSKLIKGFWVTIELIGFSCLAILAAGLLYLIQKPANGCENKEIAEIGGCDGSGMCGVAYTDGTKGFQRLPVKGFGYTVCPEPKK